MFARKTVYQYPSKLRSGTIHENHTVSVHHGSSDSGGWNMSSSGTSPHSSMRTLGPHRRERRLLFFPHLVLRFGRGPVLVGEVHGILVELGNHILAEGLDHLE